MRTDRPAEKPGKYTSDNHESVFENRLPVTTASGAPHHPSRRRLYGLEPQEFSLWHGLKPFSQVGLELLEVRVVAGALGPNYQIHDPHPVFEATP